MLPENLKDFFRSQEVSFALDCQRIPSLMEFVVALANSGGGIIRVDCRDPLYVSSTGLNPPMELVSFEDEGKTYIYVPDGPLKPYVYNGKITIIKNDQVVYAGREDILRLAGEKDSDFTSETVKGVPDNFYDSNLVNLLRDKLEEIYGSGISNPFEAAGLVKNGNPTLALLLLAGKDPSIYIPQSAVIVEGTGSLNMNIPYLVNRLFQLISGKIREVLLNQGLTEDKIHDCLKVSVEEVLINSLLHRDYTVRVPNLVSIQDASIRVWNPGLVAGENGTPDPGYLYIRNPLLYRFAGIMGLASTSGSGILKLRKLSLLCNFGNIVHEIDNGGIKTVLNLKMTYQSKRLTERERKLLEYIKNAGYITRKDYERIMGVSERTARLDLSNLVKRGILKKVGKGKNTVYELT